MLKCGECSAELIVTAQKLKVTQLRSLHFTNQQECVNICVNLGWSTLKTVGIRAVSKCLKKWQLESICTLQTEGSINVFLWEKWKTVLIWSKFELWLCENYRYLKLKKQYLCRWRVCEQFKMWMKSLAEIMKEEIHFAKGSVWRGLKVLSIDLHCKKKLEKAEYFEKFEMYEKSESGPIMSSTSWTFEWLNGWHGWKFEGGTECQKRGVLYLLREQI